jgi:cation:H+ antiporter
MTYVLLLVGFVLLIKGADFFVDGSSSIARLFKIPPVVIGLTIVAMGTSAPEAAVSITAALNGNNDIAIANIIGSNIFNLLGVVGICAIIRVVHTETVILRRDLPVNIVVSVCTLLMLMDLKVSRFEAVLLLVAFVAYLVVVVRKGLKERSDKEEAVKSVSPPLSALFIVLGLVAIIFGGDMVVDSASKIAADFGLSQNLIGLTIVAVGTSLPELVTSLVATRKGESGLALGNAVGSCIFNVLFILGLSAVISPINAIRESFVDAGVLIGASILMFLFSRSDKKTTRIEGLICVAAYIGYMVYAVIR